MFRAGGPFGERGSRRQCISQNVLFKADFFHPEPPPRCLQQDSESHEVGRVGQQWGGQGRPRGEGTRQGWQRVIVDEEGNLTSRSRKSKTNLPDGGKLKTGQVNGGRILSGVLSAKSVAMTTSRWEAPQLEGPCCVLFGGLGGGVVTSQGIREAVHSHMIQGIKFFALYVSSISFL